MSTPLSRQMDQMADAQEWKERAEAAEAKLAEAEAAFIARETERDRLLRERRAEVERLKGVLGHAQTTLDKIGWELESSEVDRSWLASVAHIERDLCAAALRGGGE